MNCSTCKTPYAPCELRPYPVTENSKCLDCTFKELEEAKTHIKSLEKQADTYESITTERLI